MELGCCGEGEDLKWTEDHPSEGSLAPAEQAKLYIFHGHSALPLVISPCAAMAPRKLNILGDPSEKSTYEAFEPDAISRMAIFPPIGIARVGDSDIECFLAPEVPGRTSPPDGLKVGSEVHCPMFPRPRHT